MLSAMKAEALRLSTLRSTLVYAILLTGSLYGPPVLLVLFARDGASPITAADLGQCVMIFLLVTIVFAGASTATEIRRGSTGVSFLTQRLRWPSLLARLIVLAFFVTAMYILGMILALGVCSLHPAGVDLSGGGWTYLCIYLFQILFWIAIAMNLAVLTRSTAAAVALPMAWLLLIENLISAVPITFLQTVAQWTPSNNWALILGEVYSSSYGSSVVTHGVGPAVVAVTAIAAFFIAVGWSAHTRRDTPA